MTDAEQEREGAEQGQLAGRHGATLVAEVAAAAAGHRTFLLADEPGLGKTAQALLAAERATASNGPTFSTTSTGTMK